MSTAETKVNDVTILMETYNSKPGYFAETGSSVKRAKIDEMFKEASEIIEGIAGQFSEKMKNCSAIAPDELKIGFSIGATTEANVWIIKGSGEMTIDVEMTWKKESEKKESRNS